MTTTIFWPRSIGARGCLPDRREQRRIRLLSVVSCPLSVERELSQLAACRGERDEGGSDAQDQAGALRLGTRRGPGKQRSASCPNSQRVARRETKEVRISRSGGSAAGWDSPRSPAICHLPSARAKPS